VTSERCPLPLCRSCGDPQESLKHKGYCRECYCELYHGKIPKGTVHLTGGGVFGGGKEPSPWGENSTRAREDGMT